jgi:S-adenosylmethionine:tRNA ribosyltransferase-isomerase
LISWWQKACSETLSGSGYYLRIDDFDYNLPADRIAAHPAARRDHSRLMLLARGSDRTKHAVFSDLPRVLRPRSLLVLNDTRVIPARLRGTKPTGGATEALLIRQLAVGGGADRWTEDWEVLARGLGRVPADARLDFGAPGVSLTADILDRGERGATVLRFHGQGAGGLLAIAETIGVIPLPPYIESARRRAGEGASPEDRERYQTVYACVPGAVAAPTAGLHFTDELLSAITAAGHQLARLTLHVGPGTFRPVEADDPAQHTMDIEHYDIPAATAAAVNRARAEGRPIVAVGTTVVRALEAAGAKGEVAAGAGATNLFLLPGAAFGVVTDLVTNFHLPRSTLLMLVAAFAGHAPVMAAYAEAVREGYRFYSYGDAMFISPTVATR